MVSMAGLLKLPALLALAALQLVAAAKPNVLLIMTDDQDLLLDSLSVMPNVTNLIGKQGVQYDKHYCTVAWCCPSRVNLLTGRAAHNTNVTTLNLPYGGWAKFTEEGLNDNWLPLWINEAGARTYYAGKLMNSYQGNNWNDPYPRGLTHSNFLVDPYTYEYFNSTWTNDDGKAKWSQYKGQHTTHITQRKVIDFIDDAADKNEQFFMMVAPVAPHAQMLGWGHPQDPPPPPAEFKDMYDNEIVPRTPNFNPDVPSGAAWVYSLPKQSDKTVDANDDFHRHRLRNLAGVDAMVGALIQHLQDKDLLDNTYIIYTTDNGFHIGNHRLGPGKRCGYEEDINIPLLIRGPGMPKGVRSPLTNSHTDIAPTVLTMMGIDLRDDFDGEPIPLTQQELDTSKKYEHVNVEFWDSPNADPWSYDDDDGHFNIDGHYYNNTYKSLRINAAGQSFYYSVWCTGEKEFYDMNTDQYQMSNLLANAQHIPSSNIQYYGRASGFLMDRLDALLMVLKSCKQDTCRNPYTVMFPKGEVTTLEQAMNSSYDKYFYTMPKVSFKTCFSGHIVELEGETEVKAFGAGSRIGISSITVGMLIVGWTLFSLL